MDEGEFADHLLEQTQALLIDVAEIPRPLEGASSPTMMLARSWQPPVAASFFFFATSVFC